MVSLEALVAGKGTTSGTDPVAALQLQTERQKVELLATRAASLQTMLGPAACIALY